MKVSAPNGKETEMTKRRKRHKPEEIVRKLRDADAMLNAAMALGLLLEVMSIRACERVTGLNRDMLCNLVAHVGEKYEYSLHDSVVDMPSGRIELNEILGFVGCRQPD
jgi:hypothetical protein